MINRKLHHIWLQGGIPEKYQNNYNIWDAFHIDWDEHNIWDENSLLELCTDNQREFYNTLETLINRVNYLKYILLYKEGGVYVDLDSYPTKPLDSFFELNEVKNIDLESILSIRYPFNLNIPKKKFDDYHIIIPGRTSLFYYKNGDKPVLLDNPVLMSEQGKGFWLKLIDFCSKRTNLKSGTMSDTDFLPHEPYGPYGMTDFLFNNYNNPYENDILVLPPVYFLNEDTGEDEKYIVHKADMGW